MTRTYYNERITPGNFDVELPSHVSVGISRGRGARPKLDFTYYFGQLSYDMTLQEKRALDIEYATTTYGRGVKPHYQVYFSITPGGFFMGLGMMSVEDYAKGYKTDGEELKDGESLILPRFDMGWQGTLKKNLKYEFLLSGLPEDVFRVGLTYEF